MAKSLNQKIRQTGKTTAQVETEQMVTDYAQVFLSEAGKRVLMDMRKQYCGNITEEKTNGILLAVGKREVIKDIEAKLRLSHRPDIIDSWFEEDLEYTELFGED